MASFKILTVAAVLVVVLAAVTASPHRHRHHYYDQVDQEEEDYRPLIRLLKQLRKEGRYPTNEGVPVTSSPSESAGNTGNTDEPPVASSNNNEQVTTEFLGQRPQKGGGGSSFSNGGGSSGSNSDFSSPEQIRRIIQQAQQSSGNVGSSLNSNIDGIISGGGGRPNPTSVTPERISQINRGVSTILDGVGSLSLERILRGSFMFTRNDNVKSVANNVLDSIFGARTPFTDPNNGGTRGRN